MKELSKEEKQARIAKNVAAIIDEDSSLSFINLGVGIPTMVSNYVTRQDVYLMAENGMLGVGRIATGDEIHPDLINAGRRPVCETPGCAYMDSVDAFGMIRGGHIDATVLGAFEVDQCADVANWIIPGGRQLGVGGAMDLVSGARKVSMVVTEYAVFTFSGGKVTLEKVAPEITLDELAGITDIEYTVSDTLKSMVV